MPPETFDQTKTALLALGGQRVWSLMVSLFGDLALTEGSTIDGPVLTAVMGTMDIRPEAVRVALHRLRNDGWIVSHKHGRTRRHSLTKASRAETVKASAHIFAAPAAQDSQWQLALLDDADTTSRETMEKRGFAQLLPRVYLGALGAQAPENALSLSGRSAPQWIRQQIGQQMLEVEYTTLLPILETAEKTLMAGHLDPLQTAVLRCLIVHNWRRIVLRHPALPPALLPDDWAGHRCHLRVIRLLNRFPRPPLIHIAPT
ncbi:phenylacetic acid degradation operon negative regulatory protein [Sulfitobacter undariae]|uniref:Phenylacetic acid degradation operon negative regulatory protein n=1 Tax=Sulfitobacter undariae TaxID=1563671 RepID=A0A7W6E8P4_9RHOB|nr:PaaX family transcriptional regulator C-terminal domain-containing protein [Sulfitobacter undariae]MBB3994065.1 phenylacetic acid degradation operon negative regulatory protein [Sulfitobacter undariae]